MRVGCLSGTTASPPTSTLASGGGTWSSARGGDPEGQRCFVACCSDEAVCSRQDSACSGSALTSSCAETATGRAQFNFPGAPAPPAGGARMLPPGPPGGAPGQPFPLPALSPVSARLRGHRPSQSVSPGMASAPLGGPGDDLAPLAPARGTRRQYAANQGAYFAGDAGAGAQGPPPPSGHGRSASTAFFSPASMADPSPAPYFTPGAGNQFAGAQGGGYAGEQPQQIPAYGQQPVANLASQFGQMGIAGSKPNASTTNLVGQLLNPAELFQMDPPQIQLPPNVRRARC